MGPVTSHRISFFQPFKTAYSWISPFSSLLSSYYLQFVYYRVRENFMESPKSRVVVG